MMLYTIFDAPPFATQYFKQYLLWFKNTKKQARERK